jgi:hypothetical protein
MEKDPLRLSQPHNSNQAIEEYVLLYAHEDLNLMLYAIIDSTFDQEEEASNIFRHVFIFPNKEINKGDFIRLYSGEGNYDIEYAGDNVIHKFYWGAGNCVWNDTGDTIRLVKLNVIQVKDMPPISH